jgi:hypothetical protein
MSTQLIATLRNSAGLLAKIIKDPPTRTRIISPELETALKTSYRRQEEAAERQHANRAPGRASIIG